MVFVDLVNIVDQRINDITKQNPSMTAKEFYFSSEEGLWCLITIIGSSGKTIEYDFIENESSWKRPDALLEYNQAAQERIKVIVIAPDDVLADVAILVKQYDGPDIVVSDYSAMGLIPMPLVY